MEQKAVFQQKLEKELEKINLKSMGEIKEISKTLVSELEDPKRSLTQNPNLDSEKENCESVAEGPVLTWTSAEEECLRDLRSELEDANGPQLKVIDKECATSSCVLDNDGAKTLNLTSVEEASKCSLIRDHTENSRKINGSPRTQVPREVIRFGEEKSLRDTDLYTKRNGSPTTKELAPPSVEEKDVLEDLQYEDICLDSDYESDMTEEEFIKLLLPKEKKELEVISTATKMQSHLIEIRSKEIYNKLRIEAEAHCLSIQQKAIDETLIFKRPSSEVAKEYAQAILMVMKYLEVQMKKVVSNQESLLKCVVDDFNENVQQVFKKVAKRKQSSLVKKDFKYNEKHSHVHNPLVFYFTFVIIMTLFSVFVVHLQNLVHYKI